MQKKIIFSFIIICIIIFLIFAYKISKSGNTINKSDNINILNMQSYETTMEVEISSNKTTNKYVIYQTYYEPNILKQEIIEPENIKGLTTVFDGTNLKIENKELNITKLYENYKYIGGNTLSLKSFVEEYKETENVKEEDGQDEKIITIKLENSDNEYEKYKKLYINKTTNLPTKMEILDINKNRTVYILYREIKINKTSKEQVLAN